jgi:multimeric flavodoxin WrbA
VINDGYQDMGALISKCDRLVVISRCFYGSYSPFVHNVLDRSLSYMLPYFETKGGETRHNSRYDNHVVSAVHFYGHISEQERETARKPVTANGANFFTRKTEISFYDKIEGIRGVV